MAKKTYYNNKKANEEISKFKLLSSYGGPGSIIHTSYGCSVIISCIEEWGFIQLIYKLRKEAQLIAADEVDYVIRQAPVYGFGLSNDHRLLSELIIRKNLTNLKYLALVPDIDLHEVFNTITDGKVGLSINSTYMPKGFFDGSTYKKYSAWYNEWPEDDQLNFSPPQKWIQTGDKQFAIPLKQDNIVLICDHGHISDFPWSKYLRWKSEVLVSNGRVNLFEQQNCCANPKIQVSETKANANGFDGKYLKCANPGCSYSKGVSLKGLMSLKCTCPGDKPWESETGDPTTYYGNGKARNSDPSREACTSEQFKVALTTGNNLYFSRTLSSIYMPNSLFLDSTTLQIENLKLQLEEAKRNNDFELCIRLANEIKELEIKLTGEDKDGGSANVENDRELTYRYQEYKAFTTKSENDLNLTDDLVIKDVTANLDELVKPYFNRVLRIDNLKITSAQLDFSRVVPKDSDSDDAISKNIFRSQPSNVVAYPVIENYGEGVFFALDEELLKHFNPELSSYVQMIGKSRDDFALSAVNIARKKQWQLYLVHTLCHLLMRELEFKCGYPTASLSERIYVSNDKKSLMYGFMIYTAEGAEGSMGGLIAQTHPNNINSLIKAALYRATVCNSDPLCWESEGQGLFDLNLACCFACGLTSETSCELRNIYLDRKILVDENSGFFKNLLSDIT